MAVWSRQPSCGVLLFVYMWAILAHLNSIKGRGCPGIKNQVNFNCIDSSQNLSFYFWPFKAPVRQTKHPRWFEAILYESIHWDRSFAATIIQIGPCVGIHFWFVTHKFNLWQKIAHNSKTKEDYDLRVISKIGEVVST